MEAARTVHACLGTCTEPALTLAEHAASGGMWQALVVGDEL